MRHGVVILIIFLLTLSSPALAEDVILGTVVSADEKSGTLVLRPLGGDDKKSEYITVTMDKGSRSGNIVSGSVVRVWGSYTDAGTKMFKGVKITSERFRFNDPAGVRSRLRNGADSVIFMEPGKEPPPAAGRPK